jgi:hypothetical protein
MEQTGGVPESTGLPLDPRYAPLLVPLATPLLPALVPVLALLVPLLAPLAPVPLPQGPHRPCELPDGKMQDEPGQQSADVVHAPQLATHGSL